MQIAYVNGTWGGYMLNSDYNIPVSNDTLYRYSSFEDWRNSLQAAQAFIDGKFFTGHKIEHKILLGLDYGYSLIKDTYGDNEGEREFGLYIPKPDYYIPPDSLKNIVIDTPTKSGTGWIALYAQDHIKIAQKLVLTIAGHFTYAFLRSTDPNVPDEQKNTKYTVFTPREGLTWLFTDDISVYALYDQSFLPQQGPSFEHKVFKPFTGYDVEEGLKSYFFNKRLSLNLSVFDIVKNNTLTSDPLHEGFFIQTGQIISDGLDFDLTGNITNAFVVNANYEYVDARVTKDSDSDITGLKNFGTPDHTANLWLRYRLPHGKLKNVSFAMGDQYMGKRGASVVDYNPDKTKFMPDYNLLDAALSYGNQKFNIALNVYNITNINYAVKAYFSPVANEWRYTPGEPINFRLSFTANLESYKKDK